MNERSKRYRIQNSQKQQVYSKVIMRHSQAAGLSRSSLYLARKDLFLWKQADHTNILRNARDDISINNGIWLYSTHF